MHREFVRIIEVGPRDGLQNEQYVISTADKIQLVDLLSAAKLPNIEVTSFVSPKWVPQMVDATEVLLGIRRDPNIRYSALTPNMKGLEAAFTARVDEVAIFAAASESFSKKNINCTIAESLDRFLPVIEAATARNLPVRGYVSCVVDCPYEGSIDPENVSKVTRTLLQMGCYEVSLGDTTGKGTPETISTMLSEVIETVPVSKLACHFHDTGGMATLNIEESLKLGIRSFDTSIGGLGGCPYAPGAKGNVATEVVVQDLYRLGYQTGVELTKLTKAISFVAKIKSTKRQY